MVASAAPLHRSAPSASAAAGVAAAAAANGNAAPAAQAGAEEDGSPSGGALQALMRLAAEAVLATARVACDIRLQAVVLRTLHVLLNRFPGAVALGLGPRQAEVVDQVGLGVVVLGWKLIDEETLFFGMRTRMQARACLATRAHVLSKLAATRRSSVSAPPRARRWSSSRRPPPPRPRRRRAAQPQALPLVRRPAAPRRRLAGRTRRTRPRSSSCLRPRTCSWCTCSR